MPDAEGKPVDKSFLVVFSKKNSFRKRFFLKKEAKTFYPLEWFSR